MRHVRHLEKEKIYVEREFRKTYFGENVYGCEGETQMYIYVMWKRKCVRYVERQKSMEIEMCKTCGRGREMWREGSV